MAQHFNCSNSTSELGSCNYSTIIDPQCYTGPHVAGVRCIQLQSTSLIYKSLQAKSDNIIMEKRESLSILLNYSDSNPCTECMTVCMMCS